MRAMVVVRDQWLMVSFADAGQERKSSHGLGRIRTNRLNPVGEKVRG